jgi:uncharacterized protein (TIGR03435 family)
MNRALFAVATLVAVAYAQAPAFELASIKTAVDPGRQPILCLVPCVPGERLTVDGARVDIRFMSLRRLILLAYRIKPYQLSGPEWMGTPKFHIVAKIPAGISKDRVPEMLQVLLAERFKLALHRESKQQQVYALVVGKNGPKLTPSSAEGDTFVTDASLTTPPGEPYGPLRMTGSKQELLKVTTAGLAEVLTTFMESPVIDMTGLQGTYQIAWEVVPPRPAPGQAPSEVVHALNAAIADAITGAIENAGLKLERRKAAVEMVVVDRLEKSPTDN